MSDGLVRNASELHLQQYAFQLRRPRQIVEHDRHVEQWTLRQAVSPSLSQRRLRPTGCWRDAIIMAGNRAGLIPDIGLPKARPKPGWLHAIYAMLADAKWCIRLVSSGAGNNFPIKTKKPGGHVHVGLAAHRHQNP
jgi:hypothetical protein